MYIINLLIKLMQTHHYITHTHTSTGCFPAGGGGRGGHQRPRATDPLSIESLHHVVSFRRDRSFQNSPRRCRKRLQKTNFLLLLLLLLLVHQSSAIPGLSHLLNAKATFSSFPAPVPAVVTRR